MLFGIALAASITAPTQCDLPKLPGDGRVVVLRMSGGDAVSTVAVAGLNDGTTTGEVRIGPGRGKLQLAIHSNEPVLVRFTGQVNRLTKVLMLSRAGAGVTGIPSSKVRFRIGNRCFLPRDPAKLRKALGRAPDVSEDISELHKAWTDGRRFRHEKLVPDYGSARTNLAEEMQRFHPGGVVKIDPAKVVSSGPVYRYSVLPDTAGALKLEQSGALVEARRDEMEAWTAKAKVHHGARLIDQTGIGRGRAYRVTRPIQLPPGLCGAHSLTLLVPSREYLSGDLCHVQVLALDGHILAPSYLADDPDCGLAAFEAQVRPHAPGPLQLSAIHCGGYQWVRRAFYVPAASPDATHMAFFPNSYQRMPLKIEPMSGDPTALHDYDVTSTHHGNLEYWYWPGSPPAYQWNDNSRGIWAAKPLSETESGRGPLRPAYVGLDGTITMLPEVRHPPGLMDTLLWVGGRGRAIATFRDPDVTDRVTNKVLPVSYGIVDAVNGVVLDDFQNADFQRLRLVEPKLKDFFYAEQVKAAELGDGRLRVLMNLRRWVLWTEGEEPRLVPDLPQASAAAMSGDGKTILMIRPDLSDQANSEIRIFCEENGDDNEPCYEYRPGEGTWASLHEVETGRLLWTLPWRFDRHDRLRNFALSPDGRLALIELVSRTERYKGLIAVVSMRDGKVLQTLSPRGEISMGFAAGGKVAWIINGKATILYSVADGWGGSNPAATR